MNALEKTDIQLGYIPLLDCIALLWAEYQGYFAEQGLNVTLVKEASWASLRDRLAYGILDAAHCLSAMLPAAATGTDQLGISFQTPLILSTTCAYISLSQKLCHELKITHQDTPIDCAHKLCLEMKKGQPIQLAHVFKHSIHHYILKEWLALADVAIAKSYGFSTLPPPYMVKAISSHLIDGFCVGEPWNTQSEIQGYSRIIANSQEIIPEIADKVLAVTHHWAEQHPNTIIALTTAIRKAQEDLHNHLYFDKIWQLLEQYQIIQFNCSHNIHVDAYYKIKKIVQNFNVSAKPQISDFEWIIQKMNQWENLELKRAFKILCQ